jgi:large subunit ribosomal protein L32e
MASDIKKLLKVKAQKRAKKPEFLQRSFKKSKLVRVRGRWKRPRGMHNKLRRRRRGIGPWVNTGYKMPRLVRGALQNGLMPVVVATLAALKNLDPKKEAAILQASVGKKKKLTIVKEAFKLNVPLVNIKDPAAYIKKIEEERDAKKTAQKEVRKQEEKKQEKKEEKKQEEAKEKEEAAKALDLEEKKEQEKKELDKILTKKE